LSSTVTRRFYSISNRLTLLDHVIFVFQEKGNWGSIARSRDIGLHGRKPVFRNLRQLVWSYFEPYIDMTGRIKGYGLTSLYELGGYDWRFNSRNMHKIEDHLRAIPTRNFVIRFRYHYWHDATEYKSVFLIGPCVYLNQSMDAVSSVMQRVHGRPALWLCTLMRGKSRLPVLTPFFCGSPTSSRS
jgi:hypothetical protein